MAARLIISLAAIAVASPALAAEPKPLPPSASPLAQREPMVDYTVETKDTLIGLGNSLLINPEAWAEVARINRLPNPNLIYPDQVLVIPVRLLRAADTPAVLQNVVGDVRLDGQPASAGQTMRPGQRLSTGPSSSVLLRLGDGSRVTLAPLGETVLTEHRREGSAVRPSPADSARYALKAGSESAPGAFASAMQLVRGSLELAVSKLVRSKPLEVSTPTAVIGVRGTQYRIHAGPSEATRTEVLEGRVRADPLHQASLGTDVSGGQGASLPKGKAPTVVKLQPPPPLASLSTRYTRPEIRFTLPGETLALHALVAADSQFNQIVLDQRFAPGEEIRLAGLEDGRWYLRMRRIDALGIEGQDAFMPFTLKTKPEPPAALAPAAAAKLPVGPVELQWRENPQAQRYQIEVARDPAFRVLVWRELSLRGAQAELELNEPGSYYWHMASVGADGENGPWSEGQRFELRPLPALARGETRADGSFELIWPALPEDRHRVQLASDREFRQLIASAELNARRWAPPRPEGAQPVYFRFRSVQPDGFVTPWGKTLRIEPLAGGSAWSFTPLSSAADAP